MSLPLLIFKTKISLDVVDVDECSSVQEKKKKKSKKAVYRTLKIVNQPEDKISTNHDVFSIIFLSDKASLYYSSYS